MESKVKFPLRARVFALDEWKVMRILHFRDLRVPKNSKLLFYNLSSMHEKNCGFSTSKIYVYE